jgi:hypothetical protein
MCYGLKNRCQTGLEEMNLEKSVTSGKTARRRMALFREKNAGRAAESVVSANVTVEPQSQSITETGSCDVRVGVSGPVVDDMCGEVSKPVYRYARYDFYYMK